MSGVLGGVLGGAGRGYVPPTKVCWINCSLAGLSADALTDASLDASADTL